MTARDIRYGRRGGRWVDGPPPAPPMPCDLCGGAVTTGCTRHAGCAPTAADPPLTLFTDHDDEDPV